MKLVSLFGFNSISEAKVLLINDFILRYSFESSGGLNVPVQTSPHFGAREPSKVAKFVIDVWDFTICQEKYNSFRIEGLVELNVRKTLLVLISPYSSKSFLLSI